MLTAWAEFMLTMMLGLLGTFRFLRTPQPPSCYTKLQIANSPLATWTLARKQEPASSTGPFLSIPIESRGSLLSYGLLSSTGCWSARGLCPSNLTSNSSPLRAPKSELSPHLLPSCLHGRHEGVPWVLSSPLCWTAFLTVSLIVTPALQFSLALLGHPMPSSKSNSSWSSVLSWILQILLTLPSAGCWWGFLLPKLLLVPTGE